MACNKYKTRNYKSALQYANTSAQPITATDIVTNPIIIDLGIASTDTGCAFDFYGRGFDVECSGLYRFTDIISVLGVTDGDIVFALTLDGVVLPETVTVVTMVAGVAKVVPFNTLKKLDTCCSISEHSLGLIAYSDGTAVGTITRISGNALKEA